MKNLWKKLTGISLGVVMAMGIGIAVSQSNQELEVKADDVTDNISIKDFAGSTATSYVTTATTDTTQLSYSIVANNFNPKTGQIRGNKSGLSNLYVKNIGIKGNSYYIKSVTLNISSGSVTTSSTQTLCEFGAAEIEISKTVPTGGQAADTIGALQKVIWTVANAETSNFKYFCIYNAKTSGTVLAAGANAIEVTYGEAGTTSTVVTNLVADPTSATYTAGDVLAAPTTVTATVDGVAGTAYSNYRVELGNLNAGTFTKRVDATFGTTTVLAEDNDVRIIARDANTAGGIEFDYVDVALTINAPVLTALTMNKPTADLNKNSTLQLSVTPTPELADASVTWSSGDETIATVDATSGLVTSLQKPGEVIITATSNSVASVTATSTITVIEAKTYNLVTSVDQLVNGKKVVLAGTNETNHFVMSATQDSNNRHSVGGTLADTVLTPAAGFAEFTLGVETLNAATVYTFHDTNGYIYAGSSGSNYLKSQEVNDDNGKWAISYTTGVSSIVAQGTNSRNVMQFNSSSAGNELFACYDSAKMSAIEIYIEPSSGPTPAEEAAAYAGTFLTATDGCVANAGTAWSAQKTAYLALSVEARAVLTNSTYSGEYSAATETQKCVWRYDLAVSKQSLENFMSRQALVVNPASNTDSIVKANSTKTSIIIIAVVGAIGLTAIVGYYFVSKKSKHEND